MQSEKSARGEVPRELSEQEKQEIEAFGHAALMACHLHAFSRTVETAQGKRQGWISQRLCSPARHSSVAPKH